MMDEYIEREAASAVIKRLKSPTRSPAQNELIRMAQVGVDRIPASDVAPVRHGRWIEYTKVIIPEPYNKWEQAWKCSECGFDDGFVAYNYCPNCGAKMDLED